MATPLPPASPAARPTGGGSGGTTAVPYGELGDGALVRLVVGRDQRALETLHRRHARACASLAARLLRDDEAVREVVQDAFVRVWVAGNTYDGARGPFLPWLLSITHRRAIDVLRVRRRQWSLSLDEWEANGGRPAPDPAADRALADAETREAVRRCFTQLPAWQRAPLELFYYRGLTQREIALALATPLGTIKSRMVAGNRRLRELLALPQWAA
jgi:RNA polymerase sigma factor (sigma-70 family)